MSRERRKEGERGKKENSGVNSAVFDWFACIQHVAGIPGGRVDGQDLVPGGRGFQLFC